MGHQWWWVTSFKQRTVMSNTQEFLPGNRCHNIDSRWINRVIWIDLKGHCIVVYSQKDCEGEEMMLSPASNFHDDLSRLPTSDGGNWSKKVKSFTVCLHGKWAKKNSWNIFWNISWSSSDWKNSSHAINYLMTEIPFFLLFFFDPLWCRWWWFWSCVSKRWW